MISAADTLFALILLGELAFFFYFYSARMGVHAIYFTWFAWIIDIFGILSGSIIMSIGIFTDKNPQLFNFKIPFLLVLALFIIGSWQASIHVVKLILRAFYKDHVCRTQKETAQAH